MPSGSPAQAADARRGPYPAAVTDEEAIRRTIAEYAHLCDDGRFDEWAGLYVEDCRFHVMGQTYEGRAATKGFIVKGQPPELRGKHICVNSVIDVEGDRARAVTDYIFISKANVVTSAGRYHDVLVREPDRWRFAERRIVFLGDEA
jgi:3-phenylpropionate/cinnamic acid dioxygenase small subunit